MQSGNETVGIDVNDSAWNLIPASKDSVTTAGVLDLNAIAEEVKAEGVVQPTAQHPQIQLTRPALLNALRQMWGKGQIPAAQLQQICRQLRIPVSYLLKGKVNVAKKKRIKALAKKARRRNRYNGSTKGQTRQFNRSK